MINIEEEIVERVSLKYIFNRILIYYYLILPVYKIYEP